MNNEERRRCSMPASNDRHQEQEILRAWPSACLAPARPSELVQNEKGATRCKPGSGPVCFSLSLALIAIPAALPNHIPRPWKHQPISRQRAWSSIDPIHPIPTLTGHLFFFVPLKRCRSLSRPLASTVGLSPGPEGCNNTASFPPYSRSFRFDLLPRPPFLRLTSFPSFRVSKSPPWSVAPHARNPTVVVT